MNIKNKLASLLILIVSVVVLYAVLTAFKYFALNIEHTNPVFSLSYTTNTGSAFGMFENNPYPLSIFGVVVLSLICIYVLKVKEIALLEYTAIIVFCAGAIGNIVERVTLGYVIDYIKLNFIDFPIFNVYDIMICIGVGLYVIYIFKDFKNEDSDKS